jgi:4-amino-4-deoxy-L-arabinose transferase-like glycosyltransferase
MHDIKHSRDTWLFWITAVLVIGAGLGLRDPWPADEPRFALVAKQMVDSGDWLFPHRGSELYPDKPPLFMWLQAIAYTLVRDWRVAFLLPSLLASLGTLWCVVDLGKRLWNPRVGLYAGWALLFAVQFTYQAKKAQIDPLVTFWITLANYGLLRHFLRGPGSRGNDWRMWVLGWFAAGLGTITKGVGAIALLMILPGLYAVRRGWFSAAVPGAMHDASTDAPVRWRAWQMWLGPLAFVLAASLWLVPMVIAASGHPDPAYRAYMDNILLRQTAGRYAGGWSHPQPPWYFLEVMLTWMPAILALPWAIPAWRRRLRQRDARFLLPLAWWALVLLFFSIPSGKRDVYILPALPMACLALAPLLPGIVRRAWPRRIALGWAVAFALLMLGAGLAMLLGDPGFERRLLEGRGLPPDAKGLGWMLTAVGAWACAALLWFGARRPVAAMLGGLAGLWVLFGLVGYPVLNDASSARGLMTTVGQRIGPQAELGLVAWKEQNLLMAARPATDFGFRQPWDEQLRRGFDWLAAAPDGRRWLLVQAPALQCLDRTALVDAGVANRRRWWLVPRAAVVPDCRPQPLRAQDEGDDD